MTMRSINANKGRSITMLALLLLCGTLPVSFAYPSFDEFVEQYRKSYATRDEERQRREIYESNLETIVMHNTMHRNKHSLAINHFMDLLQHEVPKGYDKSKNHLSTSTSTTTTSSASKEDMALKQAKRVLISSHHDSSSDDDDNDITDLPFSVDPVKDLPASVDWRGAAATPVKDQGHCGSCWAFASIAALESHVYLQTGTLFDLSVQELVSCAPNPKHCGGNGGCSGATSVQAFDLVMQMGIVQEWAFGYASYHGDRHIPCDIQTASYGKLAQDAVATIDGYVTLPSNDYTVMMNAVAKVGPIVISVAASGWQFYRSGVFSRDFASNRTIDADINHAVVLMGYGTDQETGEGYWLVRNSWSPRWGEDGYIRLLRQDPATSDESQCTMDVTPGDGDACQYDDDGNKIDPFPPQKICGTSGAYTEGYFPVGGKLAFG